ncbi:MAG TPA: hypothetical protein VEW26_13380 [Allosphingosinicella sp.]|nr:hypothetical protein [Allosphingosinicella sp.]
MSIFDDIGKAFEDAFNAIEQAVVYVKDGVRIVIDTVSGAVSTAAKATADWVEGAAFVVVRETENAAGEVAKAADQVWTRIRALAEPGKPAPPSIAAGDRVREKGGELYLLLDGKLRHVPYETYLKLFRVSGDVTEIDRAAAYPVGDPIDEGAYLAGGSSDGRVFLVNGGEKRWIITRHVFDRYGFDPGTIRSLSEAELAAIPEGAPVSGEYIAEGRRVLEPKKGGIYLKIDGMIRHIPNPATYDALFRDWSGIGEVANPQGQRQGPALTDGAHLAMGTPDGRIFLMVDGTKRWIAGPAIMDRYHFKWAAVRKLPADQLAAVPDGPPID